MAKYIVVTGGVLSGIGKGIAVATIGKLLSTNYKVIVIKCDGYLNVDPGTMNPIEHGEVFVLDDGAEVDMDFGHYERFIGINCKANWNITSGKIFQEVLNNERKGDYLGKTVQVIPHITNQIKNTIYELVREEEAEIVLVEIGGTVGDIESAWFIEAVRQMKEEIGHEDLINAHLTYIPVLNTTEDQKTKPAQNDLALLREKGINPDIVIGRSVELLTEKTKKKLALRSNLDVHDIISGKDISTVYEIPIVFESEGVLEIIYDKLMKKKSKYDYFQEKNKVGEQMARFKQLVENIKHPSKEVTIAICGKYTGLKDSYASIIEALIHAGANLNVKVNIRWIETTDFEEGKLNIKEGLKNVHGIIVPGGFGSRGIEGKIDVIKYAREKNVPYLGLCYGMQLAVIEFARNVCGMINANSTEVDPDTKFPVVLLLPSQKEVYKKGGTMRLGGQDILIKEGTKAYEIFQTDLIRRRFRHRYEVNPEYTKRLVNKGLVFSGKASGEDIMQILELPSHKFFMATQFHPELTSRLEEPSELFLEFVKCCLK